MGRFCPLHLAKWGKVVYNGGQWEADASRTLLSASRCPNVGWEMFLGQFLHTIDDKGRLTLPAKFRPGLEAGVVTTLGLDGCLFAFPRTKWEELAARIEALPITNPDARNFARLMFANADDSNLDRQGRILIPAYLRSYAKLDGDVIVTGLNTRVELWNPARWEEMRSTAIERGGLSAEHLAGLGI